MVCKNKCADLASEISKEDAFFFKFRVNDLGILPKILSIR